MGMLNSQPGGKPSVLLHTVRKNFRRFTTGCKKGRVGGLVNLYWNQQTPLHTGVFTIVLH